jgi:DNA mismatch repair protein MutS
MMQQYLTIKEDYNDAIVFFRLGDFYEMFFEDAHLASRELEIQLTGRDAGAKDRVPMCGVPHHAAESYINRLVDKGYKVAICEQVEDASQTKTLVKRDVVRVVTPGTNIDDEHALDYYIASIELSEYFYSIAYTNIASGELYALKIPKEIGALINEISAIPLKEIIVSHEFDKAYIESYTAYEGIIISIHKDLAIDNLFEKLYQDLPTPLEQKAVKRLLSYILKTQKRALMHLKPCVRLDSTQSMKMDANTIRSLELVKTMRQGHENGSLFWLINKTQTAMGARMLKKQLLKPLVNKEIIETRYDMVDALNKEFIIASELIECLKSVYDLERIVGRIAYGNLNAKDLVQLRKSLSILPTFKDLLNKLGLTYATFISESIDALESMHTLLENALLDEVPLTIKEGNMFKQGYSEDLDALKYIHLNVKSFLEKFEEEERERTGIKKLKIGYNRVFGYYIEVPKSQQDLIKETDGYTRKQTLANAERYITETLKEKEHIILSSEEKSVQLEYELFLALRDEVKKVLPIIQKNAEMISEVDMLLSFALVSERLNFVRPTLIETKEISIKESFHPVIKTLIKDVFVPNDILMEETTSIHLITGPNMSGKSTYMRQLALTSILAQIGSFVPAKEATLPIFDQLFTRIGSSDDLISGKSTFMVEMLDANHALKHATKSSLILFDEIGRGTSTYDGLAIAQAIIEYIHENIGCKTLFSTHYHELTHLEESLTHLKNIHVSAVEDQGTIQFLHKVKAGKADKSYGINVASLAKLPPRLIKRSQGLLKQLENNHKEPELNLFTYEDLKIIEEPVVDVDLAKKLEAIQLDDLSPIEALNILYELKKSIKKR